MLAHIDASGNMGQAPVFVMAGYIAPVAAWEAFSREWQEALDRPKAIKVLKMSHAMAREGQFEGWNIEDRDSRLKALAPIINRHAIASVNLVVPVESWRKYFVGKLENSYHDRPYYFALHAIISTLVKYLHLKGIDEKIDFVFDSEDGEPTGSIQDTYEQYARHAPPELQKYIGGKPSFSKDDDVLPLQAADMIAWHVRRAYYEGQRGNQGAVTSVIADDLFVGNERIECVWTDAQLKEAAQFILNRSAILRMESIPLTLPDPSSGWPDYG